MFDSTTIALGYITLCFIQLQYGSADDFNKGLLFATKKSFDNGNLVYAVCDKIKPSVTQCTVVQKNYPKKENTRSCTVTLKAVEDQAVLAISIGVSTLGKDKAILFWENSLKNTTTTSIGTLDLGTCKLTEIKIPDNNRKVIMDLWFLDKLLTYDDDSLDVLIEDSQSFGHKYGKMVINGDGTIKSEPKASIFNRHMLYHHLATIANHSPAKGYAYFRGEDTGLVLGIIKPDGTEMQLASYNHSAQSAAAVSDNLVSACAVSYVEGGVSCTQYDDDGNVKFTANVVNNNTFVKAIRNLPGGGILVILAEPKPCHTQSTCNDESRHRIVKVAADGKIVGYADIKKFDNVRTWDPTEIYLGEDTQYCAVVIAQNPTTIKGKPTDYEILQHCVKENELTI